MIAAWMAYSLLLSLLVGLAGLALERVAGIYRKPRRFVWAAAIAASLIAPATAALLPHSRDQQQVAPQTVATEVTAVVEQPSTVSAPTRSAAVLVSGLESRVAALDAPLLLLWAGASLLLAVGLLRAAVRLRRRARGWSSAVLDGTPLLVAHDLFGPAVVRLSGLTVVLPQWAIEADISSRSLMLRHELEHCSARDPDLVLGATLALVVAPWNLALWWQVKRLQLSVETDCDHRVMRAGADAHSYGSLLISVGARTARSLQLAATAFAETPSLLERRIKAMTSPTPRKPILQAALALGACALIVASAAMTPRPARLPSQRAAAVGQAQDTGRFDVLLRVRSTEPGHEVRFKAAYDVDDRGGLQFVETTTPFQATGRTHAATAMLQKLGGDAEIDAALVVGTGADTLRASAASGPRLVLQYNPRLARLQSSPNGRSCWQSGPDMGESLRDLARKYHPDAFGRDSMVVGFVFDNTCQVLRHAAMHWPASDSLTTSDAVLAKVLPGIRTGPEHFSSSGGASPARSLAHTQPVIVFGVLK